MRRSRRDRHWRHQYALPCVSDPERCASTPSVLSEREITAHKRLRTLSSLMRLLTGSELRLSPDMLVHQVDWGSQPHSHFLIRLCPTLVFAGKAHRHSWMPEEAHIYEIFIFVGIYHAPFRTQ